MELQLLPGSPQLPLKGTLEATLKLKVTLMVSHFLALNED